VQGLSNQEREFISIFSANEAVTVDANDIIKIRSISKETANQILSRLAKKGWLQRVKRGSYTIVPLSSLLAYPAIEEIWPLVVKLYKPAFLSGWTAAEHWDLTEQVFNSVSLVTQNQQRKSIQNIRGIRVKLRVLKRLGFLTETFSAPVSKKWIRECNRHIKTGISDLDPGSPSKGRISGKWNLRINLPV